MQRRRDAEFFEGRGWPQVAGRKSRVMFTHEQGALIPIAIPIPIPIRTPPNCIVLTFGLY